MNAEIKIAVAFKRWKEYLYRKSCNRSAVTIADVHWKYHKLVAASKERHNAAKNKRRALIECLRYWKIYCRFRRTHRRRIWCIWKLSVLKAKLLRIKSKRLMHKWKLVTIGCNGKSFNT